MLIADVALFHEVVALGSFSAVANKKGIAPSTVSKAIERLEKKTKKLLFHRNTRALGLTAEGADLFDLTQQWIADTNEMVQRMTAPQKDQMGLLRVNMPIFMGKKIVMPIIQKLSLSHPHIKYDLVFSDRHEDVMTNGTDVTIRIGELADSSLVAHKLGMQKWVFCCARKLHESMVCNQTVYTLARTEAIGFKMPSTGKILPWFIIENNISIPISIHSPKLKMTCGESMMEAVLLGMGIAQLPDYMVQGFIAEGRLIEVYPELRPEPTPVFAIISNRKFVSEPVQLFLNALRQDFRI